LVPLVSHPGSLGQAPPIGRQQVREGARASGHAHTGAGRPVLLASAHGKKERKKGERKSAAASQHDVVIVVDVNVIVNKARRRQMDNYKQLFFMDRPDLTANIGDVS